MELDEDGYFTTVLKLEPGTYTYRFLVDGEEQIDMNQEITEDEFGEEVNEVDVVALEEEDDDDDDDEEAEEADASADVDGAGSSGSGSPLTPTDGRRLSGSSPKLNLKMNKLDLGGVQETPRDAHGAASGDAAGGSAQETARDNVADTGSLTTPRGEHTMFDTVRESRAGASEPASE